MYISHMSVHTHYMYIYTCMYITLYVRISHYMYVYTRTHPHPHTHISRCECCYVVFLSSDFKIPFGFCVFGGIISAKVSTPVGKAQMKTALSPHFLLSLWHSLPGICINTPSGYAVQEREVFTRKQVRMKWDVAQGLVLAGSQRLWGTQLVY